MRSKSKQSFTCLVIALCIVGRASCQASFSSYSLPRLNSQPYGLSPGHFGQYRRTERDLRANNHWPRQVVQEPPMPERRNYPTEDPSIYVLPGARHPKSAITTSARWWLDTLVKMLYTHPLPFTHQLHNLKGNLTVQEAQLLALNIDATNFDDPNRPPIELWTKPSLSEEDVAQLQRDWLSQRLLVQMQLFNKWLKPRQWRPFLISEGPIQAASGQNSMPQVNIPLFEAVVQGVRRAVDECQYQMRNERWNCSFVQNDPNALFGKILYKGIPETAFVYSLISAGVVQSVAEACMGRITNCPCKSVNRGLVSRYRRQAVPDPAALIGLDGEQLMEEMAEDIGVPLKPNEPFEWAGCDHNVPWAQHFARRLFEPMEQRGGKHVRFLMNLHNLNSGRAHVLDNMELSCRCHGTSGSCAMKSCFRKVPKMRTIGNQLKKEYLSAIQVIKDKMRKKTAAREISQQLVISLLFVTDRASQSTSRPDMGLYRRSRDALSFVRERRYNPNLGRRIRGPRDTGALSLSSSGLINFATFSKPLPNQLVYYESNDQDLFCRPDPSLGILGTVGRQCSSNSTENDNCGFMCCGRGQEPRHFYKVESCNCKFVWCCRVECQQCLKLHQIETCK
ncbi:hypothetical protein Ciccas_002141 [Cichlidogyrus casuarinus]|uniref:Protein Wnt n=1 Tax=Cichlidogyrus casuarinus TaxID=1844966 RepID=A0ABD2QI39_9PLAT